MWYFKAVGISVVAAACLPLLANNAIARGAGQGEHEADSGGVSIYRGGGGSYGYSGGGGGGQGQEGPGGSSGVNVASGIDGSAVGQAQHGGGGSGYYQSAPAFESSPLIGPNTMIAGQPNGTFQVAVDPRYRSVNGTWFYQLPDNRWARFENGNWVDNNTGLALNAAPADGSVATNSRYRYINGTWLYQMPGSDWVRFESGKWVNDNQIAGRTTPPVERR
jgi:hypothetical protein